MSGGADELGLEGIAGLVPSGTATLRWRGPSGPEAEEARWLLELQRRARAEDRPAEHVHLAWEIARLAPAPARRGVHLLALVALGDLAEGSTRTPTGARLAGRLRTLAPEVEAAETALTLLADPILAAPAISADPGRPAPLLVDPAFGLQLERTAWLETRLAARLAARAHAPAPPTPVTLPPHLTEEQAHAVRAGVEGQIAVVTGGPGTGKTSIVIALVEGWAQIGIPPTAVALTAPTGKATHRLGASVAGALDPERRPRIETLHRLLGARPGEARFTHDADNPLPVRAVIVDEASLLDLELAARLVDALPPEARLVVLGDADQLPSVDAGAVLQELVAALPPARVARLTRSFRMDDADPAGRAVLELARALEAGDGEAARRAAEASPVVELRPVRSPADRLALLRDWLGSSPLGDPEHRRRVRRAWRLRDGGFTPEHRPEVEAALDAALSTQLLTVTRRPVFAHGSEAIAQALHRLYAQDEGGSEHDRFLPGEPVMMLRNDYERRLFNGDVGLVLRVAPEREPARPMAVFRGPDGPAAFDLGPFGADLVLAHAMTVHKAQGSEYDRVGILLPEADAPLLSREVIYTAVTRARRGVLLAGDPALLDLGLGRRVLRASGLGPRLRAALEREA